jgi:hypothetical protein
MGLLLAGCAAPLSSTQPGSEPCDACGGDCLEEAEPATSANHVEGDVAYPSYPPTSGDHDACWATWGVHTEPVRTESWVHDLEHGGVVILTGDGVSPDDFDELATWVGTLPAGRAVLTPASEPMDAVVAAVSWEHRLLLGCVDMPALQAFFDAHVAHGREDTTADPGACAME